MEKWFGSYECSGGRGTVSRAGASATTPVDLGENVRHEINRGGARANAGNRCEFRLVTTMKKLRNHSVKEGARTGAQGVARRTSLQRTLICPGKECTQQSSTYRVRIDYPKDGRTQKPSKGC